MSSVAPKIICISNRLPVVVSGTGENIEIRPSSGGLVTAMRPVLSKSHGIWIGWPGSAEAEDGQVRHALKEFSNQSEFQLHPVSLNKDAITQFYDGFSNQIIWPLFHDLQTRCNFEPSYWTYYTEVQEKFKDEAINHIQANDLVWVHDFHLMGLGRSLRQAGIKNKLCFFLHIPFPGPDIFMKLPWREDVMRSLLQYDLIGFQTSRDLRNFANCVRLFPEYSVTENVETFTFSASQHVAIAGTFPISIDFDEFEEIAKTAEVEERCAKLRQDMNVEFLVLSIDRLDYTKGIPFRAKAFSSLFENHPEFKGRTALLQIVVPSRVEVPEYKNLLSEIEQLVSQVNGKYGEPGWVPIHHLFRSIDRQELISMYRAADVALVTPLKDGMNLVAKEYCSSKINNRGALILSEFAGAADEFKGEAYIVNPYDIRGVADALVQALTGSRDEKKANMRNMRAKLKQYDVYKWAKIFLSKVGWSWNVYEDGPRPTTIWDRLKGITKVLDL